MRNRATMFLCTALVAGALVAGAAGTAAADNTVYAEAAYTETDLAVYIYADIATTPILSFGVKLSYDPTELTFASAEKNEAVWYLGDGATSYAYMDPEHTIIDANNAEVVICGGKLDTTAPTAGVLGDRVLLGIVRFTRTGSTMPFAPTLGLTYGKGGTYENFVSVAGASMDDPNPGTTFAGVTTRERGDANMNGSLEGADMLAIRSMMASGGFTVFADCNGNGAIEGADMLCTRSKL